MSTSPQPDHATVRARDRRAGSAPRLLMPTERADVRVTWHEDDDRFVVSLWHEDECVGTAPLSAPDAAALASYLVVHLGERGRWSPQVVGPEHRGTRPPSPGPLRGLLERARRRS